jgi:hypothetical protein
MDEKISQRTIQTWERLMYAALGAAAALAFGSLNDFTWVGILWLILEILITTNGYYLLLGKRWRALPPSREKITLISGYLGAGWLLLLMPMSLGVDEWYIGAFFGYTLFLVALLWRQWKQITVAEELFP